MEFKERQVKDQAQFHMRYWMIAILVFMGLQYLLSQQQTVATIPYSEFEAHLKAGRIDEIAVTDRRIEGTFKEALPSGQRRLDMVFWHQGERDYDTDMTYYRNALDRVISQYRGLPCGRAQLPFIAGELTSVTAAHDGLNLAIRQLNADGDRFTRTAVLSELPLQSDWIHFTAEAVRLMGVRYLRALHDIYANESTS